MSDTQAAEVPTLNRVVELLRNQDFASAESTLGEILRSKPTDAIAHGLMAKVLLAQGRVIDATAAAREAIRLKPNHAEAYVSLGEALQSQRQFEEAEKAYRTALRYQPNYDQARQFLAGLLNETGKAREAETILRQALAIGSRNQRQTAAATHALGISLNHQRRYAEAVHAFDSALALAPELTPTYYSRGCALQHLGRLDDAVASFRMALQRNPLDLDAHRDLNQLLYRMGRDREFLRSYDEALAQHPNIGALVLAKGRLQFQRGDYENARESYAAAARLMPENPAAHDGLALALARSGDVGHAIAEHEAAVRLAPNDPYSWSNFVETLLRARDGKKALAIADRGIATGPDNQYALAMWGLAARASADARETGLNDYEDFVQVFEIEPPEGYTDVESFNHDLEASLVMLHRDRREYLGQSLRGGTQTLDKLFGTGHPLAEKLRAQIDKAVAAYIARMKDDAGHPLARRRAAAFDYAGSWSARLSDCGFHANHVHPQGWISSAYYVAVPDAVADTDAKQGWIKFGEPDFDAGFADPVRRAIQPKPGRLVLFPSYMWHGTIPFHGSQTRTTVAFDVVPTAR